MNFFKNRNNRRTVPKGPPEFLVVGLGNPGAKYENTRHNAGWLCLDMMAQKFFFKIDRLKFKSLTGDAVINSHRCLFMKPQTFMNNSGEAVYDAAKFYKIPIENILVISDDAALPLAAFRIRRKGSDGGQKGLRSIIEYMNDDNFPRFKLGIGSKPHPDFDMADFVLSNFSKDEIPMMKEAMEKACSALEYIVEGNVDAAMSKFSK